jgi:plasmid stabilization system protein ParE
VAEYRFRPKARADIDGVWRYTVRTWGGPQARHYLAAIRDACAELAGRPALGKSRDELWPGLRSFPSGKPRFAVRGLCSKGRVGSSIAHRPRPAFRRRPPGRRDAGRCCPDPARRTAAGTLNTIGAAHAARPVGRHGAVAGQERPSTCSLQTGRCNAPFPSSSA